LRKEFVRRDISIVSSDGVVSLYIKDGEDSRYLGYVVERFVEKIVDEQGVPLDVEVVLRYKYTPDGKKDEGGEKLDE